LLLQRSPECGIATAAHPIDSVDDFLNPNVVKVVVDAQGLAPPSRARRCPSRATTSPALPAAAHRPARVPERAPMRHIGLYATVPRSCGSTRACTPSPMEHRRVAGAAARPVARSPHRAVALTAQRPGPGVDTPEDLARVRARFAAGDV
jgi:3-deoxy-manno-octulosonate cytidylyltransferase (CMP-KDO synthetase)